MEKAYKAYVALVPTKGFNIKVYKMFLYILQYLKSYEISKYPPRVLLNQKKYSAKVSYQLNFAIREVNVVLVM